MAREREVKPVVHKLRRVFGVAVGILAVTAIAGIVFASTAAAAPAAIIANAVVAATSLAVVGGTGLAIGTISGNISLSKNRKKSRKMLKKISEFDKGKKKANVRRKAKIVKKYAKLQLKLCKISRTPLTGVFHSVSHMRSYKGTQIVNEIDALTLLAKTESNARKVKSINKKIAKKKTLLFAEKGITPAYKWTESYDNVVDGVSVYDRRTEIACMNPETVTKFKSIASAIKPTDELGVNVIVNFSKASKLPSTYARIADKTKTNEVIEILLNDIKNTCLGMTVDEINNMFPIYVEERKINKNNTKIKENSLEFPNFESFIAHLSGENTTDTSVTK